MTVVSKLIGLPEAGRERMLVWAEEMFNPIGPLNDRTIASFPVLQEMIDYATNDAVPQYADADRFDVRRRPGDHLGFGAGPHACVGMNLAASKCWRCSPRWRSEFAASPLPRKNESSTTCCAVTKRFGCPLPD